MYAPKYRLEAIETIGRKILLEYDRTLLEGPPQAIPIETIIETKFNLTLEYHTLRKNGSVLGETIFDDGAAILYDRTERQYRLIAVKAGTILIDERLCTDRLLGRMRFTCAHELGHWVLHQKLYSGTGDVAAYDGKTSSDESCGFIERQADALATALLMPILTHCAPSSIVKKLNPGYGTDELTDFLETVKQRCQFAYWFFGHYHRNQIVDERYILQWEQISGLEF